MSKEFELDTYIPYGSSRFIQMTKDYILEVSYDTDPTCPLGMVCAGRYGSGESYQEAYRSAWSEMSSKTSGAIQNRVAQYLFDNMKVEDGVVRDTMISGAVINEYDSKVITFPNVIEDMCIAVEDEELAELTPDDLLEMVMDDYYDPFCGSDGRFSFEKMVEFCDEHNIKLDDIVLLDVYCNGNDVAVVFIEPNSFKAFIGEDFNKASDELKKSVLKESMEMLGAWDGGQVFGWQLYDKNGDEIDSCWGYYGDECIKDAIATFEGGPETIEPVKDLGIHNDIANCLYANRDTVSHDDEER